MSLMSDRSLLDKIYVYMYRMLYCFNEKYLYTLTQRYKLGELACLRHVKIGPVL